ncbi:MAG: MMPL family transporter, partial [Gaiellaceae bacterium]
MTERLARHAALHPKRILALWGAILVLSLGAIGGLLPSALTTDAEITSEPESTQGYEAMQGRLPPPEHFVNEVVLFRVPGRDVTTDAEVRGEVLRLAAALEATGRTQDVATYYDESDPSLLSPDRDATVLTIGMGPDGEDGIEDVIGVVEQADRGPYEVSITGEFTVDDDFLALSNKDLKEGELFFGLPAAMIVLLLVFGAVVASLVPILLALVSIVVALALVAIVGQVWEVSFFVVNMLSGMGLALGVDYALFIVSRFREERARGVDKLEAIAATGRSASRAVFFSGTAFVIALSGMLLVPDTILRSLAAGAVLVGITAVLAATTLLPAVLSLLGDRVDALRLPFVGRGSGEGRFWSWVVGRVQRRPLAYLLVSAALLVALTLPALDLRTGSAGVRTIPDGYTSKDGFNALERELGIGTVDSVQIVVEGDVAAPRLRREIQRLRDELARDPAFRSPDVTVAPRSDLAVVEALVVGDSRDEAAVQAVERLRRDVVPDALGGTGAKTYVTGQTAEIVDYRELMKSWLPVVFLFVLGFSFILLTIAFRSIVVPAKAIVLNLLSVGAAYGLIVLVFQQGVGNELLGFEQVDAIEAWLPLFLFSVLFGLSMYYHVFLLSRIRERFTQTGDSSEAVAFGVRTTSRLITGAALTIVVVFIGFATGELVFQPMGFGVAAALLADATLIRSVLVRRRWSSSASATGTSRAGSSGSLAGISASGRSSRPSGRRARLPSALRSHEPRDPRADLLSLVLLEEVAGALDDLGLERAGDVGGDPLGHLRREDRIRVGEEDERRLLPAPERVADGEQRG